MRALLMTLLWLATGAALSGAEAGESLPDLAETNLIDEDHGFPGVCAAPCYSVEQTAEIFLDGNPTGPGVCPAGNDTYLYRLTHVGGSIESPGIPVTQFEVGVDSGLVTSAGALPGAGIAPLATVISPLGVVSWQFPSTTACPTCLDEGQASQRLFICSPAGVGDIALSVTAIVLDAPGESLGPVEPGTPGCSPTPVPECIAAKKGRLEIDERRPGKEKLEARLERFEEATTQSDLGDPVNGSTRYDLCIYDDADQLVGELIVDRAGETCGSRPCWRDRHGTGWEYRDSEMSADGVKRIHANSGRAGRGRIDEKAANKANQGQTSMPTGIAAALEGATQARVQVLTSDSACFDLTLQNVRRADSDLFRARQP